MSHCSFLRDPGNPETWYSIEFQGTLTMSDGSKVVGLDFGKFQVSGNAATIQIGSNIITGKVMKLEKPLIVFEKKRRLDGNDFTSKFTGPPPEGTTVNYDAISVVKEKVLFNKIPDIVPASEVPKRPEVLTLTGTIPGSK